MISKTMLLEKEAELRKELARIEQLQAFAEDPELMAYLNSLTGNPAPSQPILSLPTNSVGPIKHYRVPRKIENFGARRQVLINLLTGPTTLEDLAACMKWDCALVRSVLGGMRRAKLVGVEGSRFYLTGEGKAHAIWFQRNPGIRTYRPMLIGGVK